MKSLTFPNREELSLNLNATHILQKVTSSLCIDESRVFATGFSFGAMITYSLSTNHQQQIRAAVGISPANYNIWLPNPLPRDPIAWMSTTGMSDGTTPWDGGNGRGAKYAAQQRAQDNGLDGDLRQEPSRQGRWARGVVMYLEVACLGHGASF